MRILLSLAGTAICVCMGIVATSGPTATVTPFPPPAPVLSPYPPPRKQAPVAPADIKNLTPFEQAMVDYYVSRSAASDDHCQNCEKYEYSVRRAGQAFGLVAAFRRARAGDKAQQEAFRDGYVYAVTPHEERGK